MAPGEVGTKKIRDKHLCQMGRNGDSRSGLESKDEKEGWEVESIWMSHYLAGDGSRKNLSTGDQQSNMRRLDKWMERGE